MKVRTGLIDFLVCSVHNVSKNMHGPRIWAYDSSWAILQLQYIWCKPGSGTVVSSQQDGSGLKPASSLGAHYVWSIFNVPVRVSSHSPDTCSLSYLTVSMWASVSVCRPCDRLATCRECPLPRGPPVQCQLELSPALPPSRLSGVANGMKSKWLKEWVGLRSDKQPGLYCTLILSIKQTQ